MRSALRIYFEVHVRRVGQPYRPVRQRIHQISYRGFPLIEPGNYERTSTRVEVPRSRVETSGSLSVRVTPHEIGKEHVLAIFAFPEETDDEDTEVDERWVLLTDPPIRGKSMLRATVKFPRTP